MRKLMWLTIGFGAACGVCAYGWFAESLWIPAAMALTLAVVLMVFAGKVRRLRIPAVILLGVALGLGWFQLFSSVYLSRARLLDDRIGDVTARCTDYSYDTGYGTGVDGVLYLEGRSYRTRFYLNGQMDLIPGDVITGAFRFRLTTPEAETAYSSNPGKGIFLLAYQEEAVRQIRPDSVPAWTLPAVLRKGLLDTIDTCFPSDTAAFAKALLLGYRYDLDYGTDTNLRTAGILHIIAVSGLHVTILYTLIYNLCLRKRWLVALVGLPVLGIFALVGGLTPSIVRACIMQGLIILASLFDREYDGPTELSFACLVMLCANPLVITSVSFQLSVGCMIGIFAFQKGIYDWMLDRLGTGRWMRFAAKSVSMSLSAMSLTTALVAWHFGTVSLVGVVTNLLTLWVVSLIFYGIMAVCAAEALLAGAGSILAAVISWPIRYVLMVAKAMAAFPLAAVYTESLYIVLWLVFSYVLLGLFLIQRNKRPGMFAGCVAFGLCLALTVSWVEPLTDDWRMTVLDVGQGQSILLQSQGKTYLVDCGGSNDKFAADRAAEKLLSQGISRLDGLILTHQDRDHAGGVPYFLSRIGVDAVFVPACSDAQIITEYLEGVLPGRVIPVSRDLSITYGGTEIRVFAPALTNSSNESSLAVLFSGENCDILITGDRSELGEWILVKTGDLPDLEILVAGHHGSKYSTGQVLLEATSPEIVVISVGSNPYGHPAGELLERLDTFGCTVYRTDLHGTITIRR